MGNLIAKIKAVFSVLKQGQELANAETWKQTGVAAALLLIVFRGLDALYGWTVTDEQLATYANYAEWIGRLFVLYIIPATSKRIGLLGWR